MSPKHSTKYKENPFTKRREPLGLMLWLGVVGSSLLFGVIFLEYLLLADGINWHFVALPDLFWLSTLVILFSSITLHEANLAFVQERFLHYRIFLAATLALGLTFVCLQTGGWLELLDNGTFGERDTSYGLIYVLTGLHLLHILFGVVYLGILFKKAVKNRTYIDSFVYSVNPPNRLKLKLLTRYWHFVDVLWVVVFLILLCLSFFDSY